MQPAVALRKGGGAQQQHGLDTDLIIDRRTAARLGLTVSQIDNTLYDAFGQRQVSTIYAARNQYHVVMEVAPEYWKSATILNEVFVVSPRGEVVPLKAFAEWAPATAPLPLDSIPIPDGVPALKNCSATQHVGPNNFTPDTGSQQKLDQIAIVIDNIPGERRGAALGSVAAFGAVAQIIGLPAGLIIAQTFGSWRDPFFASALFGLVLTVLVIANLPAQRGHLVGAASFAIKGATIHTEDLEVAGKLFSMVGHGDIHFLDDKLDFDVRVDPKGPGILLTPVYKLFEYKGEGSLKNPDWHPKRF